MQQPSHMRKARVYDRRCVELFGWHTGHQLNVFVRSENFVDAVWVCKAHCVIGYKEVRILNFLCVEDLRLAPCFCRRAPEIHRYPSFDPIHSCTNDTSFFLPWDCCGEWTRVVPMQRERGRNGMREVERGRLQNMSLDPRSQWLVTCALKFPEDSFAILGVITFFKSHCFTSFTMLEKFRMTEESCAAKPT